MNRRSLMSNAAKIGAGMALVSTVGACANMTSSQIQSDAQLISSGLSGILADLQSIPGLSIPLTVQQQINAELTIISQNAAQIGSLAGSNAAKAIQTAVGIIASAATPFFPAAPMVAVAVQAAITLAATLLGAASAVPGQMSVAKARAVLVAEATK